MTQHHLPEDPSITLTLRRSGRARRMSLRVSHLDGRVTLTLPGHVSDREALAFASSKAEWIRGHLAKRRSEITVAPGVALPIDGQRRTVVSGPGRRPVLTGDQLVLPAHRAFGPVAQAFLRDLARDRLTAASDHYARRLGRTFSRITLRDTRSRWGSCSSKGALMFSWRLILSPPDVLRYVAAHEVAHLAEMNHSPAFWAVVTRLYGPWEVQRRWLHDNGSALHAYRFDP
ncbi:MAG: M48 family metallopeptidase [Rhodobacteraceae bacterium]|nr:M48 family metallopeptidase [Paracoccaceae bacterium]